MPGRRRPIHHRQKTHLRLRRHSLRQKLIGVVLVAIGLSLVTFPSLFKYWTNRPITAGSTTVDFGPIRIDARLLGKPQAQPVPQRLIIPSLTIDLPVIEAKVVNGYWEVPDSSAGHGVGSANPGEKGNTVIFAHARPGLFLPLRQIKKGATIYVLTASRWHNYQVIETREVSPQDIQVIAPTSEETLTLFTCSGFLDSKRLIVSAKPLLP